MSRFIRHPSRRRDERGATAVLFAAVALVLLGVSALAVDVGQVYSKRAALQSNVDLSVLAATAKLDSSGACNQEVIDVAMDYLTKDANLVPDQTAVNLGGSATDGDGFIQCNNWRVDLWAPTSRVDYGLARAVTDEAGVDVPAHAAAQIKSPSRNASLPMFGVDGCDYGLQTIRDDSGPAAAPPIPPLTPDSTTHNTAVFTITPDGQTVPNTATQITLNGTNLGGATAVTFTGAGGPPDHHEVLALDFITASATQIVINVPPAVLDIEDIWYVRVLKGSDYSDPTTAQRFTVGNIGLCLGSLEGNFGTIDVPRTDTSFDTEWNIIFGMQPELAIHPSPAGECSGQPGSIESKTTPVDGTNCVSTLTGLKMAQANDGLISGKGGKHGRLDTDSTSNCSRSGNNSRTPTTIKGIYLNDDLLSCYIINGARLQDLIHPTTGSVGEKALSADIFKSPRFFWIPIVQKEPATGKKSWPIVAFRPGFISNQALSATNASPGSISAHNGLESEPSGLRQLNVTLFDEAALPEFAPAAGGEIDYIGSGTKVIVLVN